MLYEQVDSNKRKSALLFIAFFLFLIFLGYVFGRLTYFGYGGVIIAGIIAILMSFFSYYYSDKLVLKISKARPVSKKEYPHLVNTVEGLAIAAGLPTPSVYIIESSSPNAFATGRNPKHAAVAVTTGLLKKMNRVELEGVIAHEMSHIGNYDIRFATLVTIMVGVVSILSDMLMRGAMFGNSGERKSSVGVIFFVVGMLFIVLSPIIAQLIRFSISRRREFLADASGVMLTRYPPGLISALRKLDADKEPLRVANKATANLFIVNPLKNFGGKLNNLFSTHPSIEERIKALETA